METVVAPNIDVVKRGVLIGFTAKLGSGLGGVSIIRNLNQSLALLAIIGVVGIPQMVFTNPIMTTHVNKIIYWPLMSSMVGRRYRSADATHPRGGYWKPCVITIPIFDHRDGHYVRPNNVVLKYFLGFWTKYNKIIAQ